jgi:predicted RNase H-like nuclease
MIVGVDGYKNKWIAAAALQDSTTQIKGPLCLFDLCRDSSLDLIVIDIPIGLAERGSRKADEAARRFLG